MAATLHAAVETSAGGPGVLRPAVSSSIIRYFLAKNQQLAPERVYRLGSFDPILYSPTLGYAGGYQRWRGSN
jgi:hypothetical protein